MKNKPRIIFFDLETIPDLKQALHFWPGLGSYPGLTLRATTIINAGWKILGDPEVRCINAWDLEDWADPNPWIVNEDRKVCRAISRVLRCADIVVTHNGKAFDWKLLQTRLLFHKLPPLPRIYHIDTKCEAKAHLYSFNNKLDTLSHTFTDERKLENGGWDLWPRVWNRDPAAMRLMEDYCKQDVVALEAVFNRLRPLLTTLPNMNQFSLEKDRCPNCGSQTLRKQGVRILKEREVRRFQCMTCGAWSNMTIRDLVRSQAP